MNNTLPLHKTVLNTVKYKRERLLSGKLNCIPFDLAGFEDELPGVEQSQYVIVTANQKVGKTKLSDFLYLYTPFLYAFEHRNDPLKAIKVKIKYFSLEMSREKKMMQVMCFLLFKLSNRKIRVSLKGLNGTFKDRILDQEIIDLLESPLFEEYFNYFEEIVEIIDNIRNPFGIFNYMKTEAQKLGHYEEKTIDWEDTITKQITKKVVKGKFIKDDPDEYFIGIIDHYSLLQPEKGQTTNREAIIKFSSEYALELRDKLYCTIVAVQQQAAAQESVENKKWDKLLPSADGLGEAKITARDVDALIGLFSPWRNSLSSFHDYNITEWKDNIRFLLVINNREGAGSSICPLLFDGATDTFMVLPHPNSKQMPFYKRILSRINNKNYITEQIYENLEVIKTTLLEEMFENGSAFYMNENKNSKKLTKLTKNIKYYVKNFSTWKNWIR